MDDKDLKETYFRCETEYILSLIHILKSKKAYAESFAVQFKNNDAISAKGLAEKYTDTVWVVQNPPPVSYTHLGWWRFP